MRLLIALAAAAVASPGPPVFETGVEVVAIDAGVVDARGQPMPGLRAEDFVVTIDGTSRRVVAAEFVDFSDRPGAERTAAASHFSTNEGARAGRLVLLAIDQGSIAAGRGRAAIRAADSLLDRLTPSDRIGLVAFPPPGPGIDPTADHEAVRAALGKVVGRGPRSSGRVGPSEALAYLNGDSLRWEAVELRECPVLPTEGPGFPGQERDACIAMLQSEAALAAVQLRQQSRASIAALAALFEALVAIDGPKTVLLLSEGLWAEDALQVRGLADRAAAARASLYVLQLETPLLADASVDHDSPSGLEDQELRDNTLGSLATLTRGAVFRVGGAGEGVYERISRELSGHYLLRLEPEPSDRDGREHAIRVTTTRPGLRVRARGRLRIPPPGQERRDEEQLAAALAAPFLLTELSIRTTSYTVQDPGTGKLRLLFAAEIGGVGGDRLTYAYQLLDEKGRPVASGGKRLRELGDHPRVALTWSETVAPGDYTLKLVALDAAGRRGSVEHRLTASLQSADGLALGSLLLGPTPGAGQGFRVGVDVRSDRGVVAFLEIYPRDPRQLDAVEIVFEVVESSQGGILLSLPASRSRVDQGVALTGQARIPADVLPPGDYVMRAVVSRGGRPIADSSQPFHALPSAGAGTGEVALPRELLVPALRRFDPDLLLRAEAVSHFLDRLDELLRTPVTSPAVREATDRARRGELRSIPEGLGSPDDEPRAMFLRGLGHLARGALPQAMAAMRAAVARASNLLPAMVYLGAGHAALGQDREAVGAWQTALISESASPAVYAALADALLRLDEARRTVDVAQEALASWPDDEAMRRRLGLGLARAGRPREALALLTPHVERHPEDTAALLVTLHLLFQSLASSDRAVATEERRERARRYARAYLVAAPSGQPGREMVAHWLRYLEKTGR